MPAPVIKPLAQFARGSKHVRKFRTSNSDPTARGERNQLVKEVGLRLPLRHRNHRKPDRSAKRPEQRRKVVPVLFLRLLTGVVKDSAPSGFADALHTGSESDLARVLEDLLRMLKDEKKKIASVPREQRIAVARGVLDALGVTIEDLKPIPSRLQRASEAVEEEVAQAPTSASG